MALDRVRRFVGLTVSSVGVLSKERGYLAPNLFAGLR
jgi:hypothetical protein